MFLYDHKKLQSYYCSIFSYMVTSGYNVQKLSRDLSDIAYLIDHIILLEPQPVKVLDVFFNVKFILFVIIG